MSSQAAEKLPLWLRASIVAIGQLCAVVSILLIAVIAIYSWPSSRVSNEAVVDLGVPIAKIGVGQAIHFVAPPGTAFEMIDGAVLHGPAMFPLSHVTWRQVGPTTIAVGQSRRTVHTDRGGNN
jgi:hypothetical protein